LQEFVGHPQNGLVAPWAAFVKQDDRAGLDTIPDPPGDRIRLAGDAIAAADAPRDEAHATSAQHRMQAGMLQADGRTKPARDGDSRRSKREVAVVNFTPKPRRPQPPKQP